MNLEQDTGDTQAPDTGVQNVEQSQAQELVDLDGHSSFKYQGQTYTQDQFAEIVQGYSKYGEASKYMDDDQKYSANVLVDIEKVIQNPSLISAFKSTYPERFHAYLDRELTRAGQGQSSQSANQQTQQQPQLPKEVMDRLMKVDGLEQRLYQADVQAASAQIDATLPPLLAKYELADEDKVLHEAEKILSRGQKLTPATWERLAREDHERTQKRADKFHEAKLKSQLEKAKKGQDIGVGGSTPGQAPVKRNFAQAQDAMIQHLKNK